jgi:nickel-dependent lactate racemase
MEMDLKFGEESRKLELEDRNLLGVLELAPVPTMPDVDKAVRDALANPTGSPRLGEIVRQKKAKDAVVVVDDVTRPKTDYHAMLVPLVEELLGAGIEEKRLKFVIGVGTHRPHKPEENDRIYGKDLTSRFEFICHNCDAPDLVSLGKLSTGNELKVNKHVAETSLLVTTGGIEPHYFGGYTGGRKSILPGVSGRQTITGNHAKIVRENVALGVLKDNPIHMEMEEAAKRAKVAFILNGIQDDTRKLAGMVCGDLIQAFYKGVEFADKVYKVFVKERADVVIASGGGYPKDLNLYQSQKIVNNAFEITRPGGTIILLAECRDGVSQPVFERWMKNHRSVDEIAAKKEEDIEVEGHRAYASARMMQQVEVVMLTKMCREELEPLHFTHKNSLDEAIGYVRQKHGPDFRAYVLPKGGAIFPVVR